MALATDGLLHRLASGPFWFAASATSAVAAHAVGLSIGPASLASGPGLFALVAAWHVLLIVSGLAAWRLVRAGQYQWLLPLAAVNLVLLGAGRAGDPRTWRLEWGAFGLLWTLLAVTLFVRLLQRADELERRLHLEGAALGLGVSLLVLITYALFETYLPLLRAQWVAVTLLVMWWLGFLVSARRYRWRA